MQFVHSNPVYPIVYVIIATLFLVAVPDIVPLLLTATPVEAGIYLGWLLSIPALYYLAYLSYQEGR